MAKLNTTFVTGLLMTIILLITVFYVIADTGEVVGDAASNVTRGATGSLENSTVTPNQVLPLNSFMKKKGIILLAFIAGVVITIIKGVSHKK